ncbi:hypothetical protein EUTSA_v10003094mg [Eutrema salsugineum]|uniref:non-specific serine/threonine protein kinase n=1 Tax=Eutrema salsugineum TaxID=72664 RepID=V4L125_EUTSA|nr:hypothetical protein EUTSA_v10003094mg [Eutrema salsugineum]
MESSHGLLLVALTATFAIIHFVQAQEEGFISLDSGLSPIEQSPYTEPATGLQYSSDSNFIQTGKISRIQRSLEGRHLKPQTTVRYFPDGIRNFNAIYGNYDGLNIYPRFDLYIGPNFWVTIDTEKRVRREIFHIPRSNILDLCLVKTDGSTPFISAIEMRPVPNNTYITTSGSLKLFSRFYLSNSENVLRYEEDVYDRMWNYYNQSDWKQISTSLTENTGSNRFRLPQDALKTAVTPANTSAPLIIIDVPESANDKVYIDLHFAEVQVLQANETREFDISLNGVSINDSYRPLYLQSETIHNPSPVLCENQMCIVTLTKSSKSTHPPLLNAIEGFAVADFPKADTEDNDVVAINNIKAAYGLSRISWQGDPCVPRKFSWDGLNCSDTDPNLSSSGLTGTVDGGIQFLTHLEKLDLSNNSLTGIIPEFLANMKSLLIIKKNTTTHVEAVTPRANFTPRSISETSIKTKNRRFSHAEVMEMTNNFERALGEGGFGVVYHGYLNGSQEVAVKVLSESSSQGYKHFKAEVELLLRVHHINLVNLVGYCDERDHLALIYEYMSNGDLVEHIYYDISKLFLFH